MGIEKKSFRSGPYADFIAQGVQVGNVLYLAGLVVALVQPELKIEIKCIAHL